MKLKSLLNIFKQKQFAPQAEIMGSYKQYVGLNTLVNAFNGYSFACLHKRAKYVSGLNIYVTDKSEEPKYLKTHWLEQLLNNPYQPANLSIKELLYQIQLSKDVTGNAYIWTPLNGTNKPQQIILLPTQYITARLNKQAFGNLVESYEYQRGTETITIPANEMCHIATLNISKTGSYIQGVPLLIDAIRNVIATDTELVNYLYEYFQNSAIPPLVGVNTSGMQMTDSMWQRTKQAFKESIPAHVPTILLDSGIDVRPLQTSQSGTLTTSLVNGSISNELRKRIASIFEVPDAMLTSDFNTRSDAGYILQWFHTDTIENERAYLDDKLTKHFNQYEMNIEITHDSYDYIDPQFALQEKSLLLQYGIITKNEVRAEYDYEPLPETTENTQEQPEKRFKSVTEYKDFNEKTKADLWHYKVKQDEPYEKRIKDKTAGVFEELRIEIIDKLKKNKKKTLKDLYGDLNLIDIDKWSEELATKVTPDIRALILQGLTNAIETYGYDGRVTDFTQEITDTINESWKRNDCFKSIDDDMNVMFKRVISENPKASYSDLLDKLINETNYKFNEQYKKSNAERIARTTTTFNSSKADLIVINEMGLTAVWMSERDGKVRDSHRRADGQEPDEKGYYHVGGDKMQHPGGGGDPGENVNCRCRLFAQKKRN